MRGGEGRGGEGRGGEGRGGEGRVREEERGTQASPYVIHVATALLSHC